MSVGPADELHEERRGQHEQHDPGGGRRLIQPHVGTRQREGHTHVECMESVGPDVGQVGPVGPLNGRSLNQPRGQDAEGEGAQVEDGL
eukprot:scaffold4525_cov125-Isochrysis_galbana.AAC.3